MTDQVFIACPHTFSYGTELLNCLGSKGLRVYRDSPFTIHMQVRTHTGKKARISGISVSASEAREIAAYLIRKSEEITNDPETTKKAT